MRYQHTFTVHAPLADVRRFHSLAASMGAITPPPVLVRLHSAPSELGEGDEMTFTMWLGPLPIRWLARIEEVTPTGFVDRQLEGPFKTWVHRHSFAAIDNAHTQVHDQIDAELRDHWFWKLVTASMWLTLPMLFAFRQWKTKRLLKQQMLKQQMDKATFDKVAHTP